MKRIGACLAIVAAGFLGACSSGAQERPGEVEILVFAATLSSIPPGEASRLSWVTRHAATVEILGDGERIIATAESEGEIEVAPLATTTYLLRATSAAGDVKEATLELKVEKEPARPGVSFVAEAGRIDFGASTRLTWTTEGAVRVVVSEVGGAVLHDTRKLPTDEREFSGGLDVTPDRSTTYELLAVSAGGGERKATAAVFVDPVIVAFGSTSPGPVYLGSLIVLTWETRGAGSLALVPDEGQRYEIPEGRRESGSLCLPVGPSGRFTLVAGRGEARVTSVFTIGVNTDDTPTIVRFEAFPPAVGFGKPAVFEWEVLPGPSRWTPELTFEDQDGNPIDPVWADGNASEGRAAFEVDEMGVHAFRLIVTMPGDYRATATAEVEVLEGPRITSFTATPDVVAPGQEVTLTWTTEGATSVRLEMELPWGGMPFQIPHPPHLVSEGSVLVFPFDEGVWTYRLIAKNSDGIEESASLTVVAAQDP